jgi:hypothetical protein
MMADGIGDSAFQRLLRDQNAPREAVVEAIKARLTSDVAADIAEEIMVMDEPVKFLMLLPEGAFGQSCVRFEADVESLVKRTLPDLGTKEHQLVVNTLMYDMLNGLRVELCDWDRKWTTRIAQFKREEQALIFAPLMRESHRGGWAAPR